MACEDERVDSGSRYMIGDWVLCNGYPYRWTVKDYERTHKDMCEITNIPLSEDILNLNGWKFYYINGSSSCQTQIDDLDYYTRCDFNTCELTFKIFGHEVTLKYVYELQHVLRVCGLCAMADEFKIKKNEEYEKGII